MKTLLWIFAVPLCVAQIERPRLATVLDRDAVRPVFGVAGSVAMGDRAMEGVVSIACSASRCVVKTDSSIREGEVVAEAPPGGALIAIDDDRALVYFAADRTLARWIGGRLDFVDLAIDGEVLSVRVAGSAAADFAVRRDGGVWIERVRFADGQREVLEQLAEASGPVLLLRDAVLFTAGDELVLRRSDGSELRWNRPARTLRPVSDAYVQIETGESSYLLRVERGQEQLFEIPAAPADAQLAVFVLDGTVEKPAGALVDVGRVATGESKDISFRVRNQSTGSVSITALSLSGTGFALIGVPVLPVPIASGAFVQFVVRFTPGTAQSYSATLTINGSGVTLVGETAAEATVSVVSPECRGTSPIDFGSVAVGSPVTCVLALTNSNSRAITVQKLSVSGAAFGGPEGVSLPLSLGAGASANFRVSFTPADSVSYTGALTVDSRTVSLAGRGLELRLPAPVLALDPGAIASAQQRSLSISLPSAAPTSASGFVTLSFTPAAAGIVDDTAIVFVATGTRRVPFTVSRGETAVNLGGRSSAVFQTGTTAGTIRFALESAAPLDGDATLSISIAATPVAIDRVTGARRANDLDVTIVGFDNTYTAGVMNFTFFDARGTAIDPGTIRADFTADFRKFLTTSPVGSAFAARVTFPVFGDATQVSGVEVELVNSAGSSKSTRVVF